MSEKPIFYREGYYYILDGQEYWAHEGWVVKEEFRNYEEDGYPLGVGVFDSYVSALASNSGCWEEYCEYSRLK